MKILITGASGLLGSAVSVCFKDYFDVVSTYTSHKLEINGCKNAYLDITDAKATLNLIKKIKPKIIVHTASLVGINACEKEKEITCKVNVEGTENIADAARAAKAKIIYISTDYVFDGKKGMYKENDKPNPINYYGKTKLEGEKFIDLKSDAVIRTSIYGWNVVKERKSFSTWAIDELRNKKQINVFADQFNSMILVNNLAEALKIAVDKDINGVLNIASSERTSKYDFVLKLCSSFGLDKNLVNPIKLKDMDGSELRPVDTSLDVSNAEKQLRIKLPDYRKQLENMKSMQIGYLKNFKIKRV